MLFKVERGNDEYRLAGIFEAGSPEDAAMAYRNSTINPEWWIPRPEGIEPELWPKNAYFVYFEPDYHEDVRDSVICDDASFISVTEVKLGEMWEV